MDEGFLARTEVTFLDAATDPEAWTAALAEVAQATNSRGAALLTVEGRGPLVLPTEDMGELAQRYVSDGWYQRDFRYAGIPTMKQRGIMVDQDFVRPEEMNGMAYYAEFLRPLGFGWFAGLKIETGEDLWCLTLQRGVTEGAYQIEEQTRLIRLGQIVSRASALARRLEFVRLDGAMDVAESLSGAAMFIDRFGRVIRMNSRAEAMAGRVFNLRQGRITFAATSSEALQRHIEAVIWPDLSPIASAHLPVVVPQPEHRPLIFRAIRLRGRSLGFFSPAYAMLFVTDLNERERSQADHLQTIFRLTTSEARLAETLMKKFTLVDAAAQLNCSHETVRSQIKSIFAKTETRNQAQLVDLLGRVSTP